jgi:hypothetical protein
MRELNDTELDLVAGGAPVGNGNVDVDLTFPRTDNVADFSARIHVFNPGADEMRHLSGNNNVLVALNTF